MNVKLRNILLNSSIKSLNKMCPQKPITANSQQSTKFKHLIDSKVNLIDVNKAMLRSNTSCFISATVHLYSILVSEVIAADTL